jgi:hypothetical protein
MGWKWRKYNAAKYNNIQIKEMLSGLIRKLQAIK